MTSFKPMGIAFFVAAAAATALAAVPGMSPRVAYTGNGSTTVYAFPLKTTRASWIEVFLGGMKQISGYTVTLSESQDSSPGGTVTFATAPAQGVAVRIQRTKPLTRNWVWSTSGPIRAKPLEAELDNRVFEARQLDRDGTSHADVAGRTAAPAIGPIDPGAAVVLAAGSSTSHADVAGRSAAVAIGRSDPGAAVVTAAAGSNAPRTLPALFGDMVNVKDFGAWGDGTADDTAAIQAAINAAPAGAEVRFPRGTYRVTSTITVPKKLQLRGAGGPSRAALASVLQWAGADNGAMLSLAAGPTVVGITVSGLSFRDGGTLSTRCRFLSLVGVQSAVIERNVFTRSYVGYAIEVTGAAYFNVIRDNRLEDSGIHVGTDANSTEIVGNHILGNLATPILQTGILLDGGVNGIRVERNTLEGYFGSAGIDVSLANSSQIVNNRVEAYAGTPLRVGRVLRTTFQPNALFRATVGVLIDFYGSAFTSYAGYEFSNQPEGGQSLTVADGADMTLRAEKLAGADLADFNFKAPHFVFNCTSTYTKDVTQSDRPFLALTAPTGGQAGVTLGSLPLTSLPIRYLQDQQLWITFSVLAEAGAANTGNPSIHIDTASSNAPGGYAPELSYIPKDGRKHWIKISRRVDPGDVYYHCVADLNYAGNSGAEDTLNVYGAAVHLGTGALTPPLYAKWDAAPSIGSHVAGEIARSDSLAEDGSAGSRYVTTGWACTVGGTPGTWLPLRSLTGN